MKLLYIMLPFSFQVQSEIKTKEEAYLNQNTLKENNLTLQPPIRNQDPFEGN